MAVFPSTMSFLFVILMGFLYSSHAHTFHVGGYDGWTLNPLESYSHWAARYRFQINDELVFNYEKGNDSVLLVDGHDYFTCNKDNPIKTFNDGESRFKFDRSGPFFFISGHDQNCEKGQKLIVLVLAKNHHNTHHSPSQSPQTTLLPPASSPTPLPSATADAPTNTQLVQPPFLSSSSSRARHTPADAPPDQPPSDSPAPSPEADALTNGPIIPPPSNSPSPSQEADIPTNTPIFQPPSDSPSPTQAADTPTNASPSDSPSPSQAADTPTNAPTFQPPSDSPSLATAAEAPTTARPVQPSSDSSSPSYLTFTPYTHSIAYPPHHAPAPAPLHSSASDFGGSFILLVGISLMVTVISAGLV